jgi:hypothetical protein
VASYIRLRGKVSGPFTDEQLGVMARQGRLTPFHEVSSDGIHWISARDAGYVMSSSGPPPIPSMPSYPSAPMPMPVFEPIPQPPAGGRTMLGVESPIPIEPEPVAPQRRTVMATPTGGPWYYEAGGQQNGPIDEGELIALIEAGQMRGGDLVWEQGQPDWQPLEQTRLRDYLPGGGRGGSNTSVPVGYVFSGLALACPPLGLIGLIFGVLNCRDRDRTQHGIAQICISIACAAAGSFLYLLLWQAIQNSEG